MVLPLSKCPCVKTIYVTSIEKKMLNGNILTFMWYIENLGAL